MVLFQQVDFNSSLYKRTLFLREEVLRKPIGMVLREKDVANDRNEYHIVALDNDNLLGCVLLNPISDKKIELRQMAILQSHQRKGIGSKLVSFAENFASEKKFEIIEIRARKNIAAFYLNLSYVSKPELFEDEYTFCMNKQLKKVFSASF